ncbi:MAG: hypothetical protein KF709_09765 [Gemmatimonadaceae bacterium]|nr:hypothetical protein [Gemmatimonadaceae bacterium]
MSDPIGVPSRAPHARIERVIASSRRLTCTLAVALAACGDGNIGGGSGSPTGPPADPNAVSVGNNFFSPTSRTVAVGTTVTWTWMAGASTHNVTFSDGPTSPNQASGTYQRQFPSTGTFTYLCSIHGASMSGTVVVE